MLAVDRHKSFVHKDVFRHPLNIPTLERQRSPQPVKHVRYPSPMAHTVCIAAVCTYQGSQLSFPDPESERHCVIMCSDTRIEIDGAASGEVPYKAMHLGQGFLAMYAGDVAAANELAHRYRAHFRDTDPKSINPETISDELRKPLRIHNQVEIADHISATYGMTFEEFKVLPREEKQAIAREVQWLPRELIIIWAGYRSPRLFVINTYRPIEELSFAAIGVGHQAANASLLHRKYTRNLSLKESLYCVYEAKRNSESVPGVGLETHLNVLTFEYGDKGGIHPNEITELDVLSKQFAVFGPKPFSIDECPASLDLRRFSIPRRA